MTDDREVSIVVEGPLRYLGVDNGVADNGQAFQIDRHTTSQGRCPIIVQASDQAGAGRVTVSADGLQCTTVKVAVSRPGL